ncbi:MAG: hypothetical protein Q9191_003502 [Dirinaria sp. TL-2023a]
MDGNSSAGIYVPPEVARLIASDCDKPALQTLRLVCRSFNMVAAVQLFDRVWLAPRYADLEIAKSVAARFGPFIKTIMYTSEHSKSLSWKTYKEKIKQSEHITDDAAADHGLGCGKDHLKRHWAQLRQLHLEQKEIFENEEMFGLLCCLLTTLPQVHSVVLTHDRRKHGDCWCRQVTLEAQKRSYDPFDSYEACSVSVGPSTHKAKRDKCTSPDPGLPQSASSGWRMILHAISVAGANKITQLITDTKQMGLGDQLIQSTDENKHLSLGLNLSVLSMTRRERFHASNALPGLTRLTLVLNVIDTVKKGPMSVFRGLSQVFQLSSNLESLSLAYDYSTYLGLVDHNQWSPFSMLLVGCVFAKLKEFRLHRVHMAELAFNEFVCRQPQLQLVKLDQVYLGPGDYDHMCDFLTSDCNFSVSGTFSYVIIQMEARTIDYRGDLTEVTSSTD